MSDSEQHDHAHSHAVPLHILMGVILALLVLTFLTVAATWIDLDEWNIWIALGIALVKAAFVGLYFMHLRWDNLYHGIVLVCALLFVVLFIGIALMDSVEYQPDVTRSPTRNVSP